VPDPDEMLVVIPLPLESGRITYVVARLLEEGGETFAEAIAPVPGSSFAPPQRTTLSRYSLGRIREATGGRPALYFYEGMILPAPRPQPSRPLDAYDA
jgi:hypothetical protein